MKNDKDCDSQLNFKDILLDISTLFINLPADQIDNQIVAVQKKICELFGLNRSTLWQAHEEMTGTLFLTHFHRQPGGPEAPNLMDCKEYFPWAIEKLLAGQTVFFSKISELPKEAAKDIESWRFYETKSSVMVPLSVGGGPIFGLVTFASTREEKHWNEENLQEFKLIAQIFANSLARKKIDGALREKQAILSVATESAGIGLWMMQPDSDNIWISEKTRDIFHFSSEENITYQSFMKVIHSEDVEKVHQAVQNSLETREDLAIQYRIICPNGGIRWIMSSGKSYQRSEEKPYCLLGASFDISESKLMEKKLVERVSEIERLKAELEQENIYLSEEIKLQGIQDEIISRSPAMQHVLSQIEQVATSDSTILIQGETGVGKELIARAIHRMSARKDRPMLTVNCASLPPTLMESELFGREKGAYTGAMTRMTGRFETADGATIFLDEIGEVPMELQAKLLRILEEGRFERLGSSKTIEVNVRIIAATNRDLHKEIEKGTFRKDLFYRLNVFPIIIPPLRERREDIPPLVWFFVRQYEKKMGKRINHIPRHIMQDLKHYPWPGNARELRNIIEYAMIVTAGKTLEVRVPRIVETECSQILTLEDCERKHILDVLHKTGWRLTGKTGAAEILGLKRTTLHSKMKKLGIQRPK